MMLQTLFDKIGISLDKPQEKTADFFVPSPIVRKPYVVSQRIILCGSYLEHYEYKSPYVKGMPSERRFGVFKSFVRSKPQESMLEHNVKRSRTKIRRLVNCNDDLDKFFTLTFSESKFGNKNITNIDFCNRLFDSFVKRMKRAFPNFKYVCVPEYQGDYYYRTGVKKEFGGAVHYHLLCNLPYVDTNILQDKYWGNGHVKIKKIKDVDNVGAYVCKYLGKENFDSRFFGKKKFFYSRNLLKPVVVDKLKEVIEMLDFFDLKTLFKKFTCTFDSEYFGVVQYSQYKIFNLNKNLNNLKVACT